MEINNPILNKLIGWDYPLKTTKGPRNNHTIYMAKIRPKKSSLKYLCTLFCYRTESLSTTFTNHIFITFVFKISTYRTMKRAMRELLTKEDDYSGEFHMANEKQIIII